MSLRYSRQLLRAVDYLLRPADFNHFSAKLEAVIPVCIPLQCANNPDTSPRRSHLKIYSSNKKAINLKCYPNHFVDKFGIEIAIILGCVE